PRARRPRERLRDHRAGGRSCPAGSWHRLAGELRFSGDRLGRSQSAQTRGAELHAAGDKWESSQRVADCFFPPPSRLLLTRMAETSISLEDEFGRTVFAGWMFPMAGRLAARVALRLPAGTCRTGTGHHLCKQAFSP